MIFGLSKSDRPVLSPPGPLMLAGLELDGRQHPRPAWPGSADRAHGLTSGLSSLNKDQIAERGARLAKGATTEDTGSI